MKFALVQVSVRELVLVVHPVTDMGVVLSESGALAVYPEVEDHFRRTKLAKLFE